MDQEIPIQLVGAGKTYPGGIAAVRDVSLKLFPGERFASSAQPTRFDGARRRGRG